MKQNGSEHITHRKGRDHFSKFCFTCLGITDWVTMEKILHPMVCSQEILKATVGYTNPSVPSSSAAASMTLGKTLLSDGPQILMWKMVIVCKCPQFWNPMIKWNSQRNPFQHSIIMHLKKILLHSQPLSSIFWKGMTYQVAPKSTDHSEEHSPWGWKLLQ